jgi:putative sporulation protein YtaF
LISVILLAVAVSFDSFAMGITYGMNHIAIPFWSKVVLSIVSGFSVLLSMTIGRFLEQQIHPATATVLGGVIFVFLGLYHLWRNYRPVQARFLVNVRIPLLGLIIQVFQEPLLADSDHSQIISGKEAFILGGALALDAIAAGFGAAMLGLPVWGATVAVMVGSYFFMFQGLKAGMRLASSSLPRRNMRWLPGAIVLCMGILKIITR